MNDQLIPMRNAMDELARRSGVNELTLGISAPDIQFFETINCGAPSVEQGGGCLLDLLACIEVLDICGEKRIPLSTPVAHVLHSLSFADDEFSQPTIENILSRSSGIQDPRRPGDKTIDWVELAPAISGATRLFSPGSCFSYHSIDALLIYQIVAELAERPFLRVLHEMILPRIMSEERIASRSQEHWSELKSEDIGAIGRLCAGAQQRLHSAPHNLALLSTGAVPIRRSGLQFLKSTEPLAFGLGVYEYKDGLSGLNGRLDRSSCGLRFSRFKDAYTWATVHGPPGPRNILLNRASDLIADHCEPSLPLQSRLGALIGVTLSQITGAYEGWAKDFSANVVICDGAVDLEMQSSGRTMRNLRLTVDAEGYLHGPVQAIPTWLEFTKDPATNRVCITTGGLAYAACGAP